MKRNTKIIYSGVYNDGILFPNILMFDNFCCYKKYIYRTVKPFRAYQNDIIKNFAVVMNAVIKRVDCNTKDNPFY